MLNDTDATRLFDLDGVAVTHVHRDTEGVRVVHLSTAEPAARVCPGCGVLATRVKGLVTTRPRDLDHGGGPVRIQWLKRRWVCREAACGRGSFTEAIPQIPVRMRTTGRLRHAAGAAVADGGRTVVQAGRDLGLSWPTVHREFTAYAGQVLPEQPHPTEVLGIDEVRRAARSGNRTQKPASGVWPRIAGMSALLMAPAGRVCSDRSKGVPRPSWWTGSPPTVRSGGTRFVMWPSICARCSVPRCVVHYPRRPSWWTISTWSNSPNAAWPTPWRR